MEKLKNWFGGLGVVGKSLVVLLGLGLVAAPFNGDTSQSRSSIDQQSEQQLEEQSRSVDVSKINTTKTEEVTETENVAFKTVEKNDSSINQGDTRVVQSGQDGVRTITYSVTYENDKEVEREEISREITTEPVDKVIAVGTYVAPEPAPENCDPNYTGGCVPNVSYDLNCGDIGFSVRVVGADPHGFDRDNDGYGCESY